MPKRTTITPRPVLEQYIGYLVEQGFYGHGSLEQGHLVMYDRDALCLRAVFTGAAWIVTYQDTDRVQWTFPPDPPDPSPDPDQGVIF